MKCCGGGKGGSKSLSSTKLTHSISLERELTSPDGSGGVSRSWIKVQSLFANIVPLRGGELFQAIQISSVLTHRITIRYNKNITPKDRIIYKDREFKILSIININEMDRWMEINAREGLTN